MTIRIVGSNFPDTSTIPAISCIPLNKCSHCNINTKIKRVCDCNMEIYCSEDCRDKAWPKHIEVCIKNSELQRLIASFNIPKVPKTMPISNDSFPKISEKIESRFKSWGISPYERSYDEIHDILHIFSAVPSSIKPNVVEVWLQMQPCEKENILQIIKSIPYEEREDILQNAIKLINPEMTCEDIINILKAIASVPSEKREDTVLDASLLITPKMSGDDIEDIINVVAMIPAKEINAIIQFILQVLPGYRSCNDTVSILNNIADVSLETRSIFFRQVFRLIPLKTNGYYKTSLISILKNIPSEKREAFIKIAKRIIAFTRDPKRRIRIFKRFANEMRFGRKRFCSRSLRNRNNPPKMTSIKYLLRVQNPMSGFRTGSKE